MTLRLKLDAMRSAIITSARTRGAVSVWAQNMIGRAMRQMHSGIWQSLTRSRRLIPGRLGDRHPHASALTGRTESLIRDAWKLILPEVFEPVRGQGRVADRGHDRSVAEIGLDGASVVAVVGELEPAGMPQHVGMHEECEFRSHARPGNHALISGYGQRCATLRDEDVWGRCGFAQELAQRAAFPRRYRMHAGIPALSPADMQAPGA